MENPIEPTICIDRTTAVIGHDRSSDRGRPIGANGRFESELHTKLFTNVLTFDFCDNVVTK